MFPSFSIPTDSPKKFLAFFGLSLIITGTILFIFLENSHNKTAFELLDRYVNTEYMNIDEGEKKDIMNFVVKEIKNFKDGHDIYLIAISFFTGIGIIFSIIGFYYWIVEYEEFKKLHKNKYDLEMEIMRDNIRRKKALRFKK